MNNSKDICILTSEFPPGKFGGIAEIAYNLAKKFSEFGNNVEVMVKKKGCSDFMLYDSAPFKLRKLNGRNWHEFHYIYSFYYLFKYLRKHQNSIVVAQSWELARAAVRLKKRFSHQVITFAHGLEVTRLSKNHKHIDKFKEAIIGSDAVIAVSNFTRDAIESLCEQKLSNITTIHPAIDIQQYFVVNPSEKLNLRKQYGIDSDAKIVLTLCRMIRRKGHDIVINSMPKVLEKFPDAKYIIAGYEDLEWKAELLKLADSLGVADNVEFLGCVDESTKRDLYNLCDLYIMVSRDSKLSGDSEGFGITFLEANACGKPVIGSRTGGIVDAISDEVSGLLVDADNVEETAMAIIKLLEDKALYSLISAKSRKRVEDEFSWDLISKKVLNLLNK